jgi:hypothetical protein
MTKFRVCGRPWKLMTVEARSRVIRNKVEVVTVRGCDAV